MMFRKSMSLITGLVLVSMPALAQEAPKASSASAPQLDIQFTAGHRITKTQDGATVSKAAPLAVTANVTQLKIPRKGGLMSQSQVGMHIGSGNNGAADEVGMSGAIGIGRVGRQSPQNDKLAPYGLGTLQAELDAQSQGLSRIHATYGTEIGVAATHSEKPDLHVQMAGILRFGRGAINSMADLDGRGLGENSTHMEDIGAKLHLEDIQFGRRIGLKLEGGSRYYRGRGNESYGFGSLAVAMTKNASVYFSAASKNFRTKNAAMIKNADDNSYKLGFAVGGLAR